MSTAEKIYVASTSEDVSSPRLAERLARLIEDDIASKNVPAGGVMGSLRELSERYAAGRAAVREAVALLERRGLGRLRPGPCGGFIVAQPDAEVIGRELAAAFRTRGVRRAHLLDAREAVDLMAAGLAATRPVNQVSPLPSALDDAPPAGERTLDWHLELRSALAEMAGEPVIGLFAHCLDGLTRDLAGAEPARDLASTDAMPALREALATGDAAGAMEAAKALDRGLAGCLPIGEEPLSLPSIDTGRQEDDRTLATLVARRLAAQIQRSGRAGQRLGSEWDLCERFSVSRATLRQAIRQLQDSGLVECRRGRGNGLVVRNLRSTGGIRLMLAFLISHQMDPKSAGTILFQLNRFIPALAISRASRDQRAHLETLLGRMQRGTSIDRYDLLRLVQCVSEAADSPIIDLFSRSLAAYEARFHPMLVERLPAKVQAEYFDLLRRLLDHVAPGDASKLDWAKAASSEVMLAMSRTRPL